MKNEHSNTQSVWSKLKKLVQMKLKPERVQIKAGDKTVAGDQVTLIVDGTVLYPEHFELGIATGKSKPKGLVSAFKKTAEAARHVVKGRIGKAVKAFVAAARSLRAFFKETAAAFDVSLDIRLTESGLERLKPERVQSKLLSSPPSIPPGGRDERVQTKLKPERVQSKLKPERVQFSLEGVPIAGEGVILIVDGQELVPESLTLGVVVTKLKPERVQRALAYTATAFRYAFRGRFKAAMAAFDKAVQTFEEIAADIASFVDFSVEINLAEEEAE
jgi:hypothetical protein